MVFVLVVVVVVTTMVVMMMAMLVMAELKGVGGQQERIEGGREGGMININNNLCYCVSVGERGPCVYCFKVLALAMKYSLGLGFWYT